MFLSNCPPHSPPPPATTQRRNKTSKFQNLIYGYEFNMTVIQDSLNLCVHCRSFIYKRVNLRTLSRVNMKQSLIGNLNKLKRKQIVIVLGTQNSTSSSMDLNLAKQKRRTSLCQVLAHKFLNDNRWIWLDVDTLHEFYEFSRNLQCASNLLLHHFTCP